MHCPVCETPILKGPGFGFYCPDLECDSHIGKEDDQLEVMDRYEAQRRQRDRRAYAGMSQAARRKMMESCLEDCARTEAIWRAMRNRAAQQLPYQSSIIAIAETGLWRPAVMKLDRRADLGYTVAQQETLAMTENSVVRARIDEATKSEAAAVLAAMGLSLSDAFRLLLKRVAAEKALPFEPLVPNAKTVAAMKAARRGDLTTAGNPASLLASLNADG